MGFLNMWNSINNMGSYLLGGNGSRRQVVLTCDGERMVLPVTPGEYRVRTGQLNQVVDILDFGEAQLFGNPKLAQLSLSSFFPALKHEYPFVVGDQSEPADLVEKIKKWKEKKEPVRVIITDSPFNLMMAIKDFDWQERDGSRDVYYDLDFIEWKDLNTPQANNTKQVNPSTGLKERNTEMQPPRPNSIRRSRDLVEASQRAYGDTKYWRDIADDNGIADLALAEMAQLIINKKVPA